MSLSEAIAASFSHQPPERHAIAWDLECRFQVGIGSGPPHLWVHRARKGRLCDFARPDEELSYANNSDLLSAFARREAEFAPMEMVEIWISDGSPFGDGNAFQVQLDRSGKIAFVGPLEFRDF
jgi:hypothetical protein